MVTRLLLTCFSLLLFPYSSFADFSGQVVSVLDGDTPEHAIFCLQGAKIL
jgi:hypothetical protein